MPDKIPDVQLTYAVIGTLYEVYNELGLVIKKSITIVPSGKNY